VVAPDSLEPPMAMTSEPVFAPARLALLLQHFAEINDDRESWRVAYPLKEVRLLVTCATIASCDDFEAIVSWGEHHLAFLRRFSDFHHGVPCAPLAARSDEPDRSGPLRPLF
jgi:hypothetical protein